MSKLSIQRSIAGHIAYEIYILTKDYSNNFTTRQLLTIGHTAMFVAKSNVIQINGDRFMDLIIYQWVFNHSYYGKFYCLWVPVFFSPLVIQSYTNTKNVEFLQTIYFTAQHEYVKLKHAIVESNRETNYQKRYHNYLRKNKTAFRNKLKARSILYSFGIFYSHFMS